MHRVMSTNLATTNFMKADTLSAKTDPSNDGYGCVGGPAGSPGSNFKQSVGAEGICVALRSSLRVCLAVQVLLWSY